MKIVLTTLSCLRCGHKWHPKKTQVPVCCGFCKSPYWQTASAKPSKTLSKHATECNECRKL